MGKQDAKSLANLDQMWSGLREHRDDIGIIAEHGLPPADDEGAAQHQQTVVKLMACVVAAELDSRKLDGT